MGITSPNQPSGSHSDQRNLSLPSRPSQEIIVSPRQPDHNVSPNSEPFDPLPVFKDDTRCHLLVVDPVSLNMVDAAIGSAFGSDGKATVRGKNVRPGHMKVKVQIVLEEMK